MALSEASGMIDEAAYFDRTATKACRKKHRTGTGENNEPNEMKRLFRYRQNRSCGDTRPSRHILMNNKAFKFRFQVLLVSYAGIYCFEYQCVVTILRREAKRVCGGRVQNAMIYLSASVNQIMDHISAPFITNGISHD
jgi:hypothetical protein